MMAKKANKPTPADITKKPVNTTNAAKAKRPHTPDESRGGRFFSLIKIWQLLHTDGGRTNFNKQMLADRYFANIENEENPDPEDASLAERDAENDDDDLTEPDDDMLAAIERDDAMAMAGESARDGKTPRPYKRIGESHRRFVQRKIMILQSYGIGIEDTDEHGNVLDEDALLRRKAANSSATRWWRYDPKGVWAQRFDTLITAYGVTGSELLAFMALRDLLTDMRGTPHQMALESQFEKIKRCVPPEMWAAAIEQSHSYRHSVGNTAKYILKSEDLERWYSAALQREQVEVDYTTPGDPMRTRHLAALSTMFHREENSIYLLGSEKTATGWGPVRQWKLDRVAAVRLLNVKNPTLAELHANPLVQPAPGSVERLDANRVYDYSAGAWLQLGIKPQRMEILVRVPDVGRPGMDPETRASLGKAARRRAYNWMEWCREKPFHPRQSVTIEPGANGENQLRLIVEECYVTEMASRLLRLQDCFEVVEPRELAVLIRDYGQTIAACHDGRP